ncbi:MAG: hypothetical protein OEZ48_00115 [Candidatus Bathyarchaeota archaeon]|nr:hypothetical protein [Candidatus Bathyarchaeota archaeon]MDH5686260.1 hypothetical protein [Candidatus Bathyarchaeota archaeon]
MPLTVNERVERLRAVRQSLEKGEISSSNPQGLAWLCEMMMEVIGGLVEEAPNLKVEVRMIRLYSEYENLRQVFEKLPRTQA